MQSDIIIKIPLVIKGPDPLLLGEEATYSLMGYTSPTTKIPGMLQNDPVYWYFSVYENKGWRRLELQKEKRGLEITIEFTNQKFIGRKILIEAYHVTDGINPLARFETTLKKNNPKIHSLNLYDVNHNKINRSLSYSESIKAIAQCTDMEGHNLTFALWENDNSAQKKTGGNTFITSKTEKVKDGKAQVVFKLIEQQMAPLADQKLAKGDKDEGAYHEYYLTVASFGIMPELYTQDVQVHNPKYDKTEGKVIHDQQIYPKLPPPPVTDFPDPKVTKVTIQDPEGNAIDRTQYGEEMRISITTENCVGKKVNIKIYNKTIFHDFLLHSEDVVLPEDVYHADIYLSKSMQRAGGSLIYQNLYVRVFLYETKQKIESAEIRVDKVLLFPPEPEGNKPVKEGSLEEAPPGSCVCKNYNLIWGNKVSCEFRKKVIKISKDLWGESKKIDMANGLMAVMYVETSGTFSPSKIELKPTGEYRKDGKPKRDYRGLTKDEILQLDENFSGAVGLIQFTPVAINDLNKQFSLKLTKRKLALMSDVEQLDYVKKYFQLYNWYTKLKLPEDIYLQVFAPIGIGKDDDYVLYSKEKDKKDGKTDYESNKSVDEVDGNNDGKIQRKEILNRYHDSYNKGKNNKATVFSCNLLPIKKDELKKIDSKIVTFDTGLVQERRDVVTQKSINILEKAAKNSSNTKLIITSTIRSTRKQAEVMYTNESNGNHIGYAAPGREVIQVFKNGKAQKLSKETIINNMDKKIIELGNQGRRVSLHCVSKETYANNNIIDISYTRGVTNKIDLTKELVKDESVTKVIHPFASLGTTGKLKYDSKEPAIHVEIKQ